MHPLQLLRHLALLCLLFAATAKAEEACLRLVFDEYCLGGDIRELARRAPGFVHQQREGERFALIYPHGRDKDYVMAYRNKIYKVLRKYEPSTGTAYRQLRELLTEKYGAPMERSRFPLYASALAAKIGAIRRGEGRIALLWYPPTMPWHVELRWSRQMGLNLAYLDTEAKAIQRANENSRY